MQFAYDTDGNHHACHLTVSVWNELLRRACSQLLMWWIPNCKVVDGGVPQCGNRAASTASNSEDRASLDVCAQGFWGDRHQRAFFDVRVFNPLAPSNYRSSLTSAYRHHETQKRRRYEERVWEIEHGSFTPLVFSATQGHRSRSGGRRTNIRPTNPRKNAI